MPPRNPAPNVPDGTHVDRIIYCYLCWRFPSTEADSDGGLDTPVLGTNLRLAPSGEEGVDGDTQDDDENDDGGDEGVDLPLENGRLLRRLGK